MFGIGETEFFIILIFAFLLFGPDKLPGIGRTVGRALRQFRDASNGFTEVVQTNIMDPAAEELKKSPKQRHAEEAAKAGATAAAAGQKDETVQGESAEAPRHETFAERKARLQAEREAAAAAAPQVEPGSTFDDEDVDSDADIEVEAPAPTADAQKPAAAPATAPVAQAPAKAAESRKAAPQQAKAEPQPTSAADLYSLGQRHSERRQKEQQEQAGAAATQQGKEDGNTEA